MHPAAAFVIIVAALLPAAKAAERKSWNKIHYVGGTIDVKTSPYDWNTTLPVAANPPAVSLTSAPAKLGRIEKIAILPPQIVSLSAGAAAWRRAGEVNGARLPARTPALFGLLDDKGYFAIVYETTAGKREGLLLESYFAWRILPVLKALSGRDIEGP